MRIYRFEAKMADLMNVSTIGGRMAPPSATSATDAALGLRPRRALSSAQLSAEWTTSNPLRNDSSLNSFYPLNFVSHNMGAVHQAATGSLGSDAEARSLAGQVPARDARI
jgi:hypothetical protein